MALVNEAREWLADCFPWDEVEMMDDRELWDGIDRHYDGGIIGFAKDVEDVDLTPTHRGYWEMCPECDGYASRIRSLPTASHPLAELGQPFGQDPTADELLGSIG